MSERRGCVRGRSRVPPVLPPEPQVDSVDSRLARLEETVGGLAAIIAQHFRANASGTTTPPAPAITPTGATLPPGVPLIPLPPHQDPIVPPSAPQGQRAEGEDDSSASKHKDFLKMNPPSFDGKKDPLLSEH